MSLGDARRDFTSKIAHLLLYINAYVGPNGERYAAAGADWMRNRKVFGEQGERKGYGEAWSAHKWGLALDIDLYKLVDGEWEYQTTTEAHKPFGKFWVNLDPENHVWGGDFSKKDGNHYSYRYQGVA